MSQKGTGWIILSRWWLHDLIKWSLKCLYNNYFQFDFSSAPNITWAHGKTSSTPITTVAKSQLSSMAMETLWSTVTNDQQLKMINTYKWSTPKNDQQLQEINTWKLRFFEWRNTTRLIFQFFRAFQDQYLLDQLRYLPRGQGKYYFTD